MKEAIIVNVEGYMIDTTLVADDVTGVFPFYYLEKPSVQTEECIEELQQLVPRIKGYIIAIPVPKGLNKPRFNFTAWEFYNKSLEPEQTENDEPPTYSEGTNSYKSFPEVNLWIEGLTPEEIDITCQQSNQSSKEEKQELETLAEKLKRKQRHLVSICKRLWN